MSCILLCYIVAPFFYKLLKNDIASIAFVGVICLLGEFFGDTTYMILISRIPIFIIGMLYANKRDRIECNFICKIGLLIAFVVGNGILGYSYFKLNNLLDSKGLYYYPFIFISPAICYGISVLFERFRKLLVIEEILNMLGKSSFEIYLTHILIFELIEKLIYKNFLPNNLLIWLVSFIVITIAVKTLKAFVEAMMCCIENKIRGGN